MATTPHKVVLVIIDGLGDVTIPSFGDRTPLEVAHTPNMDALAAAGLNGLMDPVEPGLACGSDTAHMSILGYDPRKYYRGRGAFESMGAGLSMAPGDIAFKSNFATLNTATGIVESRRADRNFEHLGPILCGTLDGLPLPSFPEHTVSVRYATEHRCGVVVRGPGLSDAISGTDPLKDNLPLLEVQPLDDSPEAAHTAAVVNELSREMHKLLQGHPVNAERIAQGKNPANVVLLRGCGSRIKVPSFEELHHMRACLVAPTKIIAGLGMSFDIDSLDAPGARGDYHSALHAKADTIAAALTTGGYSFGLLHVKAVDDTGHDRLVTLKAKFLEAVDAMIGQLIALLAAAERSHPSQRYSLCVTGDHSTPVVFGDHSHEPVPFALGHVRDIVAAMGGESQLALRRPGVPIPMPDVKAPPMVERILADAGGQAARRAAAEKLEPFGGRPGGEAGSTDGGQAADGKAGGEVGSTGAEIVEQGDAGSCAVAGPGSTSAAAAQGGGSSGTATAAGSAGTSGGQGGFGPWPEAWPQAVMWDSVRCFDELSAAKGALGRFPGSEIMPLLKRFAGVEVVGAEVVQAATGRSTTPEGWIRCKVAPVHA